MKKRMIALLLALAMIVGLLGCQKAPEAEQAPTEPAETAPPAPDPAQVYADARAALDSAAAVTLDVVQTTTITVEEQNFTDEITQVLTYTGLDTDAPAVRMEQEVVYDYSEEEPEEEDGEILRLYTETYSDGTLYVEVEEEVAFSGSLSAEECTARYVPVVLLDAALYENLTLETAGDDTMTIHFADPTAAESWAIPEEAEFVEASGEAVISADGGLQQMNYTVSFDYGPARMELTVESKPREAALSVEVPEDTDRYTPLQYVDALRVLLYNNRMKEFAQTMSVKMNTTIVSEAAGIAYNADVWADMHDTPEDLLAKVRQNLIVVDPQYGRQTSEQEESYKDGKCVITVDDGVPTTQRIKEEEMKEYLQMVTVTQVPAPIFWQDVTVTDLGGVYLLEYTYTEEYGETTQNGICTMFFQNPGVLNNIASAYATNAAEGYLAVDKYTGFLTASGLYYEGVHTIEGEDFILSTECNQAVEFPSFSAYSAITEELQPETEPEQKATPLFYHVTGTEGQEMWLLGTIHVGDARTGFLPQEIYDAFAASDAVAMEVNLEAFEEQLLEDEKLQQKVSDAYFYADHSTTEEHLDEELYAKALQYLKACGDYYEGNLYVKPTLWQSSIENFYLQQGHQLHSEQGVEERLMKLAKEQEKPILEVESALFQLQMTGQWSDELQQLLLEETLSYSTQEYWTETYELYELWCAGDEAALLQELSGEEDLSQLTEEELAEYEAEKHLYDEYDKTMSHDRNDGMLDVAIDYLESGDVVFYAVGLAHLLDGTNGLVEALRAAGYTVELVTYYQ